MKKKLNVLLTTIISFLLIHNITAQGTWTPLASGTSQNLYGLQFLDANTGWISGANGVIRKTTNGGINWTAQSAGTQWNYGLSFLDTNTGWLVGSSGLVWRTTNGGTSWASTAAASVPLWGIGFKDVNTGFTNGQFVMYQSTNGGSTWSSFSPGGNNTYYFDIKFLSSNTNLGWTVGSGGWVRYTTNGGATWTAVNAGTQYLRKVHFIDANTGWVCGDNGAIYKSTNGGVSWVAQTSGTTSALYGIYMLNSNEGWIVGQDGKMLYTNNSGTTWTNQSGPVSTTLNNIYFSDSTNGWIVGINGVLLKYNSSSPVPNCTEITFPLPNSINVPITSDLTWAAVNDATGYKIYGGTSLGATNLFNGLDVGNVTTYNPASNFPPSSYIYIKIVPYNASGNALNCIEKSFNTGCSDLIVESLIFNSYSGSTLNFTYTIKNIGTTNILNGTTVVLQRYNSINNVFEGSDPPSGGETINVGNLAPNGIITGTVNHSIDTNTFHFLIAQIDSNFGFTECNENNNVTIKQVLGGCTNSIAHNYNSIATVQTVTCLTCTDGIQNGDETAVDCGGVLCAACNNNPPNCTALNSPINGSINILVTSALNWNIAIGNPLGYKLTVGTSPDGGQILTNFNVGNVLTYNPPGNFPCGSTIYVKIVPYNSFGDAIGCYEESFNTQPVSCPTNLFLSSQSQINNFATTYPCCSAIPGNLIIAGTGIINLQGLSQITSVGDIFELYETHVTNLMGLENLHKIGGIAYIHYNSPYLTNLNGLSNLDSIYGNLEIFANAVSFNNIQALSNLDYIGDELRIQFNPNLSNCAISEICEYLALPPAATFIGNNGSGCNSTVEILSSCNPTFPLCTSLTNPLNSATNVSSNTNISWSIPSGSPSGYNISIGTSLNGTEILDNYDVGNTTTYDPLVNLPYGTIIYVKIKPYNTNGETYWCNSESFIIEPLPLPSCTSLVSPVNGATNILPTASLNWLIPSGNAVTGYKLSVGTAPNNFNILNYANIGNDTTFNPSGDFPNNAIIYVKNIPYNQHGDALNCPTESFTISNFVCPLLTSPVNGSNNVQRTTRLTWTSIGNPTGYKLTLGTSPNNSNILPTTNVGNVLTYDLPGEFPQDSTIYVKVVPFNQYGEATGCINEIFETAPLIISTGPWSKLDVGLSEEPFDIELDTFGNLLAVGNFSHAGGLAINNIAKWDGDSWNQFQPNISTFKIIVDSFSNNIYAFSSNTVGFLSNGIWTTLGSLTSGSINDAHLINGSQLYVTGNFNEIEGVPASMIAKWDGNNWNSLGSGLNNTGNGLASFGINNIYVVGNFTEAGGIASNHIAKWNGNVWSSLGSGVTASNHIDCDKYGNLYTANQKWNGSIWTNISTAINGTPYGIIAIDTNEVYLYGAFTTINNTSTGHIGKWNGNSWTSVGYPGPNVGTNSSGSNHNVSKMVISESGEIYIIGKFLQASGIGVNYVAKYDSTIFIPSCTVLSSPVNNATNVIVSTNLSWPVSINAIGYKLIIGTSIGGSEFLNNLDVGNVLTYDPPVNFEFNTTYYIRLVPYNSYGESLGCFESTFKTALNGGQGLAYIPNAFTNNLSVISLIDFNVVSTIPVGSYPTSAAILQDGSKIYVSNRNSGTVSVIDPISNSVVQTISVGNSPISILVSGDGTKVYVVNYSGYISEITVSTSTVDTINVSGINPVGLAISPNDSLLYVTNYLSDNVSVINTNSHITIANIPVGDGPQGIAINQDGTRVFVTNFLSNNVSVINTVTNTLIFTIPAGVKPVGICLHPDGTKMYVCNSSSSSVQVINIPTYGLITSIPIGGAYGNSISCNGNLLVVTRPINSGFSNDPISIVNTITNSVFTSLTVGEIPLAIGNFISSGFLSNELILNSSNSPLNGSYNAAQSIEVAGSVNINPGVTVELNARKVKILSSVNTGLNSQIKINGKGCIE